METRSSLGLSAARDAGRGPGDERRSRSIQADSTERLHVQSVLALLLLTSLAAEELAAPGPLPASLSLSIVPIVLVAGGMLLWLSTVQAHTAI